MKVYRGQYGFQLGCYGKDLSGNESKYYMSVQFKRGMEPKDSCEIKVKDFFMSAYTKRDGHTAPKLIITDYELVGMIANSQPPVNQESQNYEQNVPAYEPPVDDEQLTISPNDLPFY